jgi:NADH-quinone oxidoreductase subunit G
MTAATDVRIDGTPVDARKGETVLQVALRNGIDIPYFCYHPKLSIAGNCRICLVKVEGVSKLMPSCNVSVADHMKVDTASPEVVRARREVMQFIALNHPVDCDICDKAGECRVQDHLYAHGAQRTRSIDPKHHKRKLYDLTPRIQLDNERCILCSRCVRFTKEISKTNLFGIVERAGHAYIERNDDGVADPYSDNVIGLCPTGALLSRDFLYRSRVWYLEPVRSVCNGCARGCSVNLWRRKKQWRLNLLGDEANRAVYRVTAFDNPEINGPWICNKGFDLHKIATRERALAPMIGAASATLDEALDAAQQLLAQSQRPAALVSSQASSEELAAFEAALGAKVKVYTREDCAPAPGEIVEDGFLIKADKNPNGYDMRARFGSTPLTASDSAAHDVFVVWGEWADYAILGAAKVIHLTAYPPPNGARPDVLVPLSTWMERDGTFVNFDGKRNRFAKVFDKPPLVAHAVDVFARLDS